MPTILVVDDEVAMRDFVHRSINPLGHTIVEAGTAEEALAGLATATDVAVAVVDLEMPGHGGAWLIDEIQQRWPSVAIVLATVDQAVPGTLTLRAPVVRYIVKPASGDELQDAVAEGLAWHQAHLAARRAEANADPIDAFLDRKLTHPETPRE